MSLLFEIQTLVEFMSIGTLLAYTIVAAAVIIVRYQSVADCQFKLKAEEEADEATSGTTEESAIIKKSKSHDDFGKLKEKKMLIQAMRLLFQKVFRWPQLLLSSVHHVLQKPSEKQLLLTLHHRVS
jgi:NRPS condensation-like uncharacterized protein